MISDLYMCFAMADFRLVRQAYIERCRAESRASYNACRWLTDHNYEDITDSIDEMDLIDAGDARYLPDGREVFGAHGREWVINKDIWAQHLAREFGADPQEQPRTRDYSGAGPAPESLSLCSCPQIVEGKVCGGSLQQSGICPRCELGKQGYIYRYTCESCGYDIATREPL